MEKKGNAIMLIDEIHQILGAGSAGQSNIDAAQLLKPILSKGDIQVIGATTYEEYRKHIERDAALERRFQPIQVAEPSVDDTIEILRGVRSAYEEHHKLKILDEALLAASELSSRYVADRFLPDKAIDLIDEASARVRIRTYQVPPEIKNIKSDMHNNKLQEYHLHFYYEIIYKKTLT